MSDEGGWEAIIVGTRFETQSGNMGGTGQRGRKPAPAIVTVVEIF